MMMPMGWIWLLLFLVGGLLLCRALTNRSQQDQIAATEPKFESAHEILLKEFARGSITEEEYLQKKKYLD